MVTEKKCTCCGSEKIKWNEEKRYYECLNCTCKFNSHMIFQMGNKLDYYFKKMDYSLLKNKVVDAEEMVSFLAAVAAENADNSDAVYCYQLAISFIYSHLLDRNK